jgi:nanoRNase/pAp phosphatase (c-di-AMP/oligoRNAs hydrolase)
MMKSYYIRFARSKGYKGMCRVVYRMLGGLCSVLESIPRGSDVAFVGHDWKDCDFLGVVALDEIASQYDHRPSILDTGVSHPVTKAMISALGIRLQDKIIPGSYFILADNQGPNCALYRDGSIPKDRIIGIIDHHVTSKGASAPHKDVRDTGAVSTILAEYFIESGSKKDTDKAYAALALGIFSDTKSLKMGAKDADMAMYEHCMRNADRAIVRSVLETPITNQWHRYITSACTAAEKLNGYLIASVGSIKPGDRDVIPMAADEVLRLMPDETVFVGGTYAGVLDVSIRTNNGFRFDVLERAFPTANVGGRKGCGRMMLPSYHRSDVVDYLKRRLV